MLNSKSLTPLTIFASVGTFKILLIVRPNQLINLLRLELSHEGYEVEIANDGMLGLVKYREIEPQLIILDWSIANFAAPDICYRLRSSDSKISIIVLDSGQKVSDRVAALDGGADDCVAFPFAMSEFLARVRVQLRKYQVKQPSVLWFKDLSLNTSTREVYRGDRYIYLTTKEFNLLEYLLMHPKQVLTRNQIIERIWGHDYTGDSNVIEVYIRYLRLKIEKNNAKRLIYTVRGVGYVLREKSPDR